MTARRTGLGSVNGSPAAPDPAGLPDRAAVSDRSAEPDASAARDEAGVPDSAAFDLADMPDWAAVSGRSAEPDVSAARDEAGVPDSAAFHLAGSPDRAVISGRPAESDPAAAARLRGLVRALRPRQWLKNVLVFAAPAAAGVLTTPGGLLDTMVAFVAFCLAASGGYLLNDAADAEADRRHPRKRLRPIAAGIVPVRTARVVAVAFMLAAPALAAVTGDWRLPAVVAGYLALTIAYSHLLKHEVIVDLVAVAGCHVIRAYAGAVAVDVPVTSWFLVVVSLGSLQVVVGKREAEIRNQGSGATRSTLVTYTPSYLAHVRAMASGAMIVTYCMWALQVHPDAFYGISIVPFVLVVLRHNLLVDRGFGEEPEELALRDRPLQVYMALLVALLVAGIYV